MHISVREARPTDSESIADFNSRMAVETEGRPLDPALIDPGVQSLLADPGKGRYWVAETNCRIIGRSW